MTLQFIHDHQGNTTGVFIPIEDWQTLKTKYAELQIEEVQKGPDLGPWQKDIIDERLNTYYKNPSDIEDFEHVLKKIESAL